MNQRARLIIPTYNRPAMLRRALSYYAESSEKFPLTIADSSEPHFEEEIAKIIGMASRELAIIHDRYPSSLNPHYKFAAAMAKVVEPYVILAADDDFVVPHSIKRGILYLDANPDYAMVHGAYVSFHADRSAHTFRWQPIYGHQTRAEIDAVARMKNHIAHYYPTHFGLSRSAAAKEAYGALHTNKIDPVLWGELIPSFLLPLMGKQRVLPILWSIRDAHSSGRDTWPTLDEFKRQGRYKSEYERMRNAALPYLTKYASLRGNAAERFMDETLAIYIARLGAPKTRSIGKRIYERIRKTMTRGRFGDEIERVRALVLK